MTPEQKIAQAAAQIAAILETLEGELGLECNVMDVVNVDLQEQKQISKTVVIGTQKQSSSLRFTNLESLRLSDITEKADAKAHDRALDEQINRQNKNGDFF